MFAEKVVKTHWGAVMADSSHPARTRVLHAVCPLAFVLLTLLPGRVWASSMEILSGVSIVTGLLFSLVVFLITMRYQVRVGEIKAVHSTRDKANLDYGFYTACYSITVGLALIAILLLEGVLAASSFADASGRMRRPSITVRLTMNALIYALSAHFAITLWGCIRRLWRLYEVVGLNQD